MKKLTLGFLLVASVATAQTQTVFINGVGLQATPVTEKGVVYYKFKADDLKRVGAITAGGVTPKMEAVKGCVGDTLFNGVYTVQLLNTFWEGDRFGATLKIANASKQELHNFMLPSPSDVKAANKAGNAVEMPNDEDGWLDTLLPGANTTVKTMTDNIKQKGWTRLLVRPSASSIRELQDDKLPLAKVYNMEFDLTCTKK
ncbi:hypothetical protein ACFOPQ_02685 [Deinococcus antarcticus]|uniref:DUF4198 domain-containing protein n=1 Tax=Deinococcus antarcticus TaxID=1298767 RepID=A0ABV8A2L0_9DEIO